VTIYCGDAAQLYPTWTEPVCIIVDGPYGVSGFPGDPPNHERLAAWYEPHIRWWTQRATPQTTLWFWNTEIGWATVHPVLVDHGWEYRCCHIWNKGRGHVAGNANSHTLRKFPVVTEVCVQYVKPARFVVDGKPLSMQDWLRHEWGRSKLPLHLANAACGVRNAATRKYLTGDHLWYYPPAKAFESMFRFANRHGDPSGRPYFSIDGKRPLAAAEWAKLRAKFHCEVGVNNVWDAPPVRGPERVKSGRFKALHLNQKPLHLIDLTIRACTDEGDTVWEPFGGLCPAAVSAHRLGRRCVSAETNHEFFLAAADRLASYDTAPVTPPARPRRAQERSARRGSPRAKRGGA
jgi:site-specific DNA-methyltransferase (adenine-specific)